MISYFNAKVRWAGMVASGCSCGFTYFLGYSLVVATVGLADRADAADHSERLHRRNSGLLRYPFKSGVFHHVLFREQKNSLEIKFANLKYIK